MPDKTYAKTPVELEGKRTLRAWSLTNNPDGSRVIDAQFEQLTFDKEGNPALKLSEPITVTALDTVSDSINTIESFLNAQKDAAENGK